MAKWSLGAAGERLGGQGSAGESPPKVDTARPVRNGVMADRDLTHLLLKSCMQKASRNRYLRHVRVMIGVAPDNSSIEPHAVAEPAEAAGGREVYRVHEPIAAALGVGPFGYPTVIGSS